MLSLLNHGCAINDDVFDAFRILMRVLERCLVDDSFSAEDGNVCLLPGLEQPAIFNTQLGSIQRSHLLHRLFQSEHLFFAHILSQNPRKCPIPTWMWFS